MLMPDRGNDSKREGYSFVDRVSIDEHQHAGKARKYFSGENANSTAYMVWRYFQKIQSVDANGV